MLDPAVVLIYGSDSFLIKTRRWVLEKEDFRVLTAQTLTDVCQTLSAGGVDLLVLCHTLPATDRDTVLSLAHSATPEVQALVMDGLSSDPSAGINDTVLSAFTDPRLLISNVRRMTLHRSFSTR